MGLCMSLNLEEFDEEYDVNMSYGYYLSFRIKLLNSLDEGLGDQFKDELLFKKEISENLLERLNKLNLIEFCLHSDCDGKLGLRIIKKTLKTMEKIEIKKEDLLDYDFCEKLEEVKKIFRKALELHRQITYC